MLPLKVTHGDLGLYARSFHMAAKKLAEAVEPVPNLLTEFNVCPVVFMYRHALELHLKALVLGEGGNFLATRPDHLSIMKTHSVSWLSQFVCQIITALKWEAEFKCEGVHTIAEFKAAVEELNAVDPGSFVLRLPISTEGDVLLNVRHFAHQMDALLNLLDATADALAATWDMTMQEPLPPLVF
jgi:hypothetical protein